MAQPIATDLGGVLGTLERDVRIFKGIPFAKPPLGDLRWRPPQLVESWNGVLAADAFKPQCMQLGPPLPTMPVEPVSEDCLYLNVWAPARAAKRPSSSTSEGAMTD